MFLKLNRSCPLLFCPVCCAQGSAAWPGPNGAAPAVFAAAILRTKRKNTLRRELKMGSKGFSDKVRGGSPQMCFQRR